MDKLVEVDLLSCSPERFAPILRPDQFASFEQAMDRASKLLEGRVFWHVNSTPRGGGVAEILHSLIPYLRGAGVDCRWVVIQGKPDFFRVTKRLHNNLHGDFGDGGELGTEEKRIYEESLDDNVGELTSLVGTGDVVLLHDPQTAGLIPHLREVGASVVWRCHVGLDTPNDLARRAWNFLKPYVLEADVYIFSRHAFAWEALEDEKIWVVAPSIDPFSSKNQEMDPDTVHAILTTTGLAEGSSGNGSPIFGCEDGSEGRVGRRTRLVDGGPPPPTNVKLVVQVSRWDRLKDPLGVMEGFVRYVAGQGDDHLVLAGPDVDKVADDPEGAEVLGQAVQFWRELPEDVQPRIHLAALPMEDPEENAAIVNALQRRADVVVQKSLAEGFGLTVSEAMWKGRPVVASRIGGIQDQIEDGESGLLVTNPSDLAAYGSAVVRLLRDDDLAARMGSNARERVRGEFLHSQHLVRHVQLLEHLLGRPADRELEPKADLDDAL